jgi:alpha-glutamyl/putrescinyl thymine pyrophosphorylase clade 1
MQLATAVFNTFWQFACERQHIFYARYYGAPTPWTADSILQKHKFTNAYRAADRVSQFLIRRVIYSGDPTISEVVFRILLFKLFNRINTWKLWEREFGEICYGDFTYHRYSKILDRAQSRGERLYSAAYIMPSKSGCFDSRKKHRNHLMLLDSMMREKLPERIADAASMREAYFILRQYPMIGPFLAYQYVTDINYSEVTNFSEMEFVVAGPGALSGIRKCFPQLSSNSEEALIRKVTEQQEEEFAKRGLDFKTLWGRSLQLIDCQNLFCEVDKYARVAHPEFSSKTTRTKIKQLFRPNVEPIDYWFPPKWGINHRCKTSALLSEVECI